MQELPGTLFNHDRYCHTFKLMISSTMHIFFTLHENGYENQIHFVHTFHNSTKFWTKLA